MNQGRAFERIAIVNRGEPAMRLINAVREWNAEGRARLRVIAAYSAADPRDIHPRGRRGGADRPCRGRRRVQRQPLPGLRRAQAESRRPELWRRTLALLGEQRGGNRG